jgi:hypothetical protein
VDEAVVDAHRNDGVDLAVQHVELIGAFRGVSSSPGI